MTKPKSPINKPIEKPKSPAIISPYQQYLAEIDRYPLLTKEKEREYAVKYTEQKDPKAARILVTSNLRFVVKIAQEYSNYGIKIMDLIQEGNIGLMRAVKTFNPYKNVRLVTYAVWWIRAYIQEYIQKNWSLVKMGTTQAQRKLFYKLSQEKKKLEAMGETPSVKLLSQNLKVKEREVVEMQERLSARDLSLDAPLGHDDSGRRQSDLIMDEQSKKVVDRLAELEEKHLFKERIEEFKKKLEGREKEILELRLLAEEPLTLEDLGKKHGITKERVRQLEKALKKRLKEHLTK